MAQGHGIRKVHLAEQLFGFWPLTRPDPSPQNFGHRLPNFACTAKCNINKRAGTQTATDRDSDRYIERERRREREREGETCMSSCHTKHKVSMGQVPGIGHMDTSAFTCILQFSREKKRELERRREIENEKEELRIKYGIKDSFSQALLMCKDKK